MKQNILDLSRAQITEWFREKGLKSYTAKQLLQWMYQKKATSFEEMTNLSKDFRAEMPALFDFTLPEVLKVHKSVDGTIKFLFNVYQIR